MGRFGRLDIVVSNAYYSKRQPLLEQVRFSIIFRRFSDRFLTCSGLLLGPFLGLLLGLLLEQEWSEMKKTFVRAKSPPRTKCLKGSGEQTNPLAYFRPFFPFQAIRTE